MLGSRAWRESNSSQTSSYWCGTGQVLAPNGISWLRLDGGVDTSRRFGLVQRFNADPTIDVMLLTTAVGC